MLAADKLRVTYSKSERDLMFHWPLGTQTKCDAHRLNSVFTPELLADLKQRGYDITTLRFSIEPQRGHRRIASQRPANDPGPPAFFDAKNGEPIT